MTNLPMKPAVHSVLVIAVGVLALFSGCGRHPQGSSTPDATPSRSVRVIIAQPVVTDSGEDVTGTVRARLQAAIEPKVSGRIARMLATPGRQVVAGELLAELDAGEIQARLDQAVASRDQAERDAKRFAKLLDEQAVTRAEAETIESRWRVAQAAVAEAQTMLGYVRITAPFAGVVTRKLADVGDLAMPGRAIAELEDPAGLRLEADVPESLVSHISIGEELPVRIGEAMLAGKISEIAPTADPVSRTLTVKLDLPAGKGFRTGQFGRVRVPASPAASLRVPASALVVRGQMETVFVVTNQRAELRLVKTGRRLGDGIEIISGLSAGDVVVVEGAAALVDGQPLTINQ